MNDRNFISFPGGSREKKDFIEKVRKQVALEFSTSTAGATDQYLEDESFPT